MKDMCVCVTGGSHACLSGYVPKGAALHSIVAICNGKH